MHVRRSLPDNEAFPDAADAFDELIEAVTPFAVAEAPEQAVRVETPGFPTTFADAIVPVQVLSLDGQWLDVTGRRACPARPAAWLSVEPGVLVKAGMSGSPIIGPDGAAMAAVSTGSINPIIREMLPAHITRALGPVEPVLGPPGPMTGAPLRLARHRAAGAPRPRKRPEPS